MRLTTEDYYKKPFTPAWAVTGGDASWVHVCYFDNELEARVWLLNQPDRETMKLMHRPKGDRWRIIGPEDRP